jgi:hypothetical protein
MIKIENVKAGDTFVFYRNNPKGVQPGYYYTPGNHYTVQDVIDDHIYMTDNHSGGHRWSEEMFNFCFSKPQRKVRKVKRIAGVYQLVREDSEISSYVQVVDDNDTRPVIGGLSHVKRLCLEMRQGHKECIYKIRRLTITPTGTTSEVVDF